MKRGIWAAQGSAYCPPASALPGMCTLHANSAREALAKMCTNGDDL